MELHRKNFLVCISQSFVSAVIDINKRRHGHIRSSLSMSTTYPWFWEEIYTLPVRRSFTGWFPPRCPYFILKVSAPVASAINWCPRQMANMGKSVSYSFLISFIIAVHSFGSPGPLLSIMPSGLSARISSALVHAGYTATSHPRFAKDLAMFSLPPNPAARSSFPRLSLRRILS